jgi:hypothetical protein
MKQQKNLQTEAKKVEKASESLNNINEQVENADDIELTEDQLDVVSGGTINPGMSGDDGIFKG